MKKTNLLVFAITYMALTLTNVNAQSNVFPASGKVGIGTTTPTSTLQVVGMTNNGSDASLKILTGFQGLLLDGNGMDGLTSLTINGVTKKNATICPNGGNVAIGAPAGNSRLYVLGTANDGTNAAFKLQSGTNTLLMDGNTMDANAHFWINKISKKNVSICSHGGNVGIGTFTWTPSAKLEVYGITGTILKVSGPTESMDIKPRSINTVGTFELNNSGADISMCSNGGKVSVGKNSPTSTFEINGMGNDGTNATLKLIAGDQTMILDGNEIDALSGGLYLNSNSHKKVILCKNGGSVGIGTDTPSSSYKLSVNGGIRAKEVVVEAGWSDFVFEKGYDLKSLGEVEEFINKNGHLPEIPNAEEIAENGVNLGEIESKLLMKIEELTLYIIDQNKRLTKLEQHNR